MATSRTRNLRLFLSSGLSTEAKANLEILDRLGGVYQVDNSEAVNIRSKTDIRLLPGDPAAGGRGESNLIVGSESDPVKEFKIYADVFEINGSLRLPDYLTPLQNRKYLTIRYDSSKQGDADTAADRELLLDMQNGNRALILEQDLALTGGFKTTFNTTAESVVTLPTEGILATLENEETLKNKTINLGDPDGNVLTGIADGSVASDAKINIAKLELKTSIANISQVRLDKIVQELQEDIDTRATTANFLTHTQDKSAHGVDSDIVGVNDVQTLTNKTLAANTHFSSRPTGLLKQDVGLSSVDNYSAAELAALPQTLTNKHLNFGSSNSLENVPRNALLLTGTLKDSDWSSSSLDKLTYEKLNLTSKIVDADIASGAQLSYSKLNLGNKLKGTDWSAVETDRLPGTKVEANFGAQQVITQSGVRIGQGFTTTLGVQSQTSNLNFKFPPNEGGLNYVLVTDGLGNTRWSASEAGGSVSKVGLTAPNIFSVTTRDGSGAVIPTEPGETIPFITVTGQFDLAFANQTANLVFASPIGSTGSPAFRQLQETDLPAPLNSSANRNQMISDQVNATIKSATGPSGTALSWTYDSATRSLTPTFNLSVFSTLNLPEGSNLYYTDARVATKAKGMLAENDGVTSGIIVTHGTSPDSISLNLRQLSINTDNITEGSSNKFFSTELAQDAINALIVESPEISKSYDDAGNSLTFALKTTGVSPGSYGSATKTVTVAVDNKGRLTSAVQQDIAIPSSQVTDFREAVEDVVGTNLVGNSNDIAATYDDGDPDGTLTLALRNEAITSKTDVTPTGSDYVLISDSDDSGNLKKVSLQSVANLSGANFTATWTTGTSLQIQHNLNSRDVLIQIYSLDTYEDILVESIVRTTLNSIDLTASEAPTGSGWKVLIRRI